MRRFVVVLVGSMVIAGCGGTSTSQTAATTRATTTTAGRAPRAASAELTVVGDTGVAGPVTKAGVTCGLPSLAGTGILVIGQPAEPTWSIRITVSPGKVLVGVDSGSGAQYRERDFTGTGITHFDADTGVRIDSTLTEVPGQAVTTLGVVRSISGTIDCGSSTNGTTTLAFSGQSAAGAYHGKLDSASVRCPSGNPLIIGVIRVAGTPTLVDLHVTAGSFGFFTQTGKPGDQHQYQGAPSTATATATGFHVDGDAVESVAAGGTSHTLHVSGDIDCPGA